MRRTKVFVGIVFPLTLLFLLVIVAGCASPAEQKTATPEENVVDKVEDAASFYKGKVINFIVPYAPGGGYDAYARLFAPFLEKYTGATVIVKNIEGGGSLIGTNQTFMARPDGLTIGTQNCVASLANQIVGMEGIEYDLREFSWIGRMTEDYGVMVMRANLPYRSFEELKNHPEKLKFGVTGIGGKSYLTCSTFIYSAGINGTIIFGYDSSAEYTRGLLRGEVDLAGYTYSSIYPMIKAGEVIPIVQSGFERDPREPNIPTYLEVAVDEQGRRMVELSEIMREVGRPIAGPPGIPEYKLQFLRDAFDKTMEDPELIKKAEQLKMDLVYASGEDMESMIDKFLNMPEPEKVLLLKLLLEPM